MLDEPPSDVAPPPRAPPSVTLAVGDSVIKANDVVVVTFAGA